MSVQLETQRIAIGAVEEHETVIIGGGQAGLAVGYWLSRLGCPFVILDANAASGTAGAGVGTPCACSRLPGATGCPACPSQHASTPSPPVTRWRATSRTTQRGSSSRCATGYGSTRSAVRQKDDSSSRPTSSASRPITS